MPLSGILEKYLNLTANIERRVNTRDVIGDFTEVWSGVTENVSIALRPLSIAELKSLPQGKEYNADHKVYLQATIGIPPVNGDRIYVKNTNLYYAIKSVELKKVSKTGYSAGHHYKLFVERIKEVKA